VNEGSWQLPPDMELVTRLQHRDEAAFALLFGAWSGRLLSLARTFLSTNESAAEVVQETWLAVVKGICGFEGRSSLKTWVFRILVKKAKRRSVRERRTIPWSCLPTRDGRGPTADPLRPHGPGEENPERWQVFPARGPPSCPEREVLAKEIYAQVTAALDELPERQRVVMALRDVEGHSAEEVCEILEISLPNQRVLLHRARALVRSRLETYFASGESEDHSA
jgi:RNA polymerase sigma-70 factor, ECF subfamily